MFKKLNTKYSVCLYLAIVFAIIQILNSLLPLYFDDWVYSYIFRTNDKIQSIGDIFYSQYLHYFLWGGRSVAHIIAQFLLLINKHIADILNSIIYLLLIYCIYVISKNSSKSTRVILISVISSLIVLCSPTFLETVLWKTGSANYLWTTLIIILYLMPFIFNIYKAGQQKATPIVMFVGGIIAGWTNENTGFALLVSIFIFLYFFKKNYNKIPLWAIFGVAGVAIGFCFMVLAPGNGLRPSKGYLDNPNFSYLAFYLIRISHILRIYIQYLFPLTMIYCLIFIIYRLSNDSKYKEKIIISLIFLFMAHLSIFVMIASPVFPDRAAFGAVIFLIISICILFSTILTLYKDQRLKNLFLIFTIGLALASCYKYFVLYKDAYMVNRILKERKVVIDSFKKKNIYDINIKGEIIDSPTFTLDDLMTYPNAPINEAYAKYENINSITLNREE